MGNINEKIRRISLEDILCFFIIICPILEITSFLFRNIFNTTMSPSTILRPIIPIVVILYLFFKENRKFKLYTFLIGVIYFVYGIIHLYIFETLRTRKQL